MASHIQNVTIKCPDGSPTISYKVSYVAERDGSNVTYTFTIQCLLHGSSSAMFGTGYGLKGTITVNGVSSNVTLKSTSDSWKEGSDAGVLQATKTVSVTCKSNTGEENQTVNFVVGRTDSGTSATGEVSTSAYYVTSPIYFSECTAPTSFVLSPEVFSSDAGFTLTWSGANPGDNNPITAYECQSRQSSNGSSWGSWMSSTINTSGQKSYLAGAARGTYIQYRIRTIGRAGSDWYSGWKESNVVRKNSLPGKPSNPQLSATYAAPGDVVTASWTGSTDPDNNHNGYRLSKRVNGGDYETISSNSTTSRNVTINGSIGDVVEFFVRAEDKLGETSDYLSVGSVKIVSFAQAYRDGSWKRYLPHIFDGTTWKPCAPHRHDGTAWKTNK